MDDKRHQKNVKALCGAKVLLKYEYEIVLFQKLDCNTGRFEI